MIESDKYYLYEVNEGFIVVNFQPRLRDKLIKVKLESELPEDHGFEGGLGTKSIIRRFETITHFMLKNDGSIHIDEFMVPPPLRKKGLGKFILKKAISAFDVSPATHFYGMLSRVDIPEKSVEFWSKVLDTNTGKLEPATDVKDGFFDAPLKGWNG